MSWTTPQPPLNARNVLRGLLDLPWGATLYGPVRVKRPD